MKKLGFTLAEVLITLVIIGVIAAMTVPTLLNNTNQQEFRTGLKKAVAGLNQALTLNYALESEDASDMSDGAALLKLFKKRMSVLSDGGTFPDGEHTGNVFTTADGMMFVITTHAGATCGEYNDTVCGTIYVDVNGKKKPNALTASAKRPKDVYQLDVYGQRIVPSRNIDQQVMYDEGGIDVHNESSSSDSNKP